MTFTANPNWPEIRAALAGKNQQPAERYDVISRVFKLKLMQMLSDFKDGVLGPRAAEVMCVEWQKRGLPHAHILLFFAAEAKLRDAADYDTVVCAEIPPVESEPVLHERVLRTGLHSKHPDHDFPHGGRGTQIPFHWFHNTWMNHTGMNHAGHFLHAPTSHLLKALGRLSLVHDTRAMWPAELQQPMHEGRAVYEEVPKSLPGVHIGL